MRTKKKFVSFRYEHGSAIAHSDSPFLSNKPSITLPTIPTVLATKELFEESEEALALLKGQRKRIHTN